MTNTEIDELYRLTPDRFAFAQAIAELAISDALISVSHAVAEEREACKAACRSVAADWRKHGSMPVFEKAALACCDAIDERSNGEVRGASRLAGEASSAEGATSTVVLCVEKT